MKKTITILSMAMMAGMPTMAAPTSAASLARMNPEPLTERYAESQLPAALRAFLKTPEGMKYSAADMMRAIRRGMAPVRLPEGVTTETVLSEDFSLWTAGELGNPDPTTVEDNSLMQTPGDWALFLTQQAGGCAYTSFDEVGEDGPGYIKTFGVDVSGGEGIWRVSCKAYNANPNAQDQLLQGMFFDEAASMIHSASSVALTYGEWTDCEWIISGGGESMSAMVLGWQGKIYIDDLRIEQLSYPLASPGNVSATLADVDCLNVTWDKVEGATGYRLEATDSFGYETYGTEETGDTDNCRLYFTPGIESVTVSVTALADGACSYPGTWHGDVMPESIGECTAQEATDVNADGFTANWTKALNAATYLVGTTRTFEASADGEELVILDEDFTQIPGSYNDMKPATICPMLGYDTLDLFFSRAGWSTDVCMMFYLAENMPCMVLTNMYAAYGLPGTLMSPYADFSVAGGKVTVSGMAMSAAGEIVLHIGFMDADGNINNPQEVTFSEEPSQFEVEVEGGTENSCLAIRFADAEEDETMLAVFSLGASMSLNAGEKITLPYRSAWIDYKSTSARFDTPVDDHNSYTYKVFPYFNDQIKGAWTETVNVVNPDGVAELANAGSVNAYIAGGKLHIANPDGIAVEVYSADGARIGSTRSQSAAFDVDGKVYIVRAGGKAIKLIGK